MRIIEINLLPPEYTPPSPYSLRNIATSVLSLLVAVLLILLALPMVNLKNEYNKEYKQLVRNIGMYGKQKQQINELKRREVALDRRRGILMELIGQRTTLSDKLIDLYEQIPENLWLSDILLERKEIKEPTKTARAKGGKSATKQEDESEEKSIQRFIQIQISGDALKIQQISEFIARLDKSPSFENTKLLSIGQIEKKGRTVMSFDIITRLAKSKL